MRQLTCQLIFIIAAIYIIASPVIADDLALITITSQQSAETATSLVGHAYAKTGDRFLVLVNAESKDGLRQSGIPFEIVASDTRSDRFCLVHSADRKPAEPAAVDRMGRAQSIGDGLFIVETTPSAAAAIGEQEHLFVIPLTQRELQIHYTPPTVPYQFGPNDVFPTDTVVNRVSKDSAMAWDKRLEAFYTRHIWSDSTRKAREWMISKFQQWGYT